MFLHGWEKMLPCGTLLAGLKSNLDDYRMMRMIRMTAGKRTASGARSAPKIYVSLTVAAGSLGGSAASS